jgi:transposase
MKDIIPEPSVAVGPVGSEGGRSPSTLSTGKAVPNSGLAPGQRWRGASARWSCVFCVARRQRACRGNWVCQSTRLERWRERALSGIDGALREREGDPLNEELAGAMKRIGELTMDNEVLRARVGHVGPLARRRSR